MKYTKKPLSILLTLALVLGLLPWSVLPARAATVITGDTTDWSGEMAVESDVSITYDVKLSGDTTLTIASGKTLTVCARIFTYGGYTLTVKGGGTLTVNGVGGGDTLGDGGIAVECNLVVESGTVNLNGGDGYDGYGGYGGGVGVSGNVTVNGGDVTIKGGNGGADYGNGGNGIVGNVEITGGTVEIIGGIGTDAANGGNGIVGNMVTLKGGELRVTGGASAGSCGNGIVGAAVTLAGGALTVAGGTGGTEGGSALYGNATVSTASGFYYSVSGGDPVTGDLTDNIASNEILTPVTKTLTLPTSLTGGTVTADKTSPVIVGATVTLTITPETGCAVDTLTVTDASNNAVTVSGTGNTRIFTMPNANVTVSATFTQPAAQVGTTKYPTLQEAIDKANSASVTLLRDVTLDAALTVPVRTTVTLNLAGHTIDRGLAGQSATNSGTASSRCTAA